VGLVSSWSAAKLLDRANAVTPVAPDQPIPVIDFFRRFSLENAMLDRAGTYFAAVASAEGDQATLLVYDLSSIPGLKPSSIAIWPLKNNRPRAELCVRGGKRGSRPGPGHWPVFNFTITALAGGTRSVRA
jgi:hypothetical protein